MTTLNDVKFLNLDINNAEGVVTDGAIRDLSEVKKYGFKIFNDDTNKVNP